MYPYVNLMYVLNDSFSYIYQTNKLVKKQYIDCENYNQQMVCFLHETTTFNC